MILYEFCLDLQSPAALWRLKRSPYSSWRRYWSCRAADNNQCVDTGMLLGNHEVINCVTNAYRLATRPCALDQIAADLIESRQIDSNIVHGGSNTIIVTIDNRPHGNIAIWRII